MKHLTLLAFVICVSMTSTAHGQTQVSKEARSLLLVTNLSAHGRDEFKWLYEFLEGSSVTLAETMLAPSYEKAYLLAGDRVTSARFISATKKIAMSESVVALDTLIHLHGSPGKLWFVDGGFRTADLSASMRDSELTRKGSLRALYSTACYGASHGKDMLDAGYQVATGAIGVNTNGVYEYPVFMSYWSAGYRFDTSMKHGTNADVIAVSDELARWFGFEDVDSRKVTFGDGRVRINQGI